jgi:hypothetical protein
MPRIATKLQYKYVLFDAYDQCCGADVGARAASFFLLEPEQIMYTFKT